MDRILAGIRATFDRLTAHVAQLPRHTLAWIGLALGAVILLSVNLFAATAFRTVKADLTQQRLFTISDGTRAVLRTIEQKDVAIHVPEAQIAWLEADLARCSAPAIVLMHHPASEMHLEENRWFENAPHICRVSERKRVRSVIERSGKVVAVFNGHVHWNHLDVIRGIPYITLQSMVENLEDDAPGRAAGAFAVCDLDPQRLTVSVYGEETHLYQFELAVSGEVD